MKQAMSGQSMYDMNQVIAQLGSAITHERYSGNRVGTIPPDALEEIITKIIFAAHSLKVLYTNDIPLAEITACSSN